MRNYPITFAGDHATVSETLAELSASMAEVSAKKALWEVIGMVQSAPGEYAEAIRRAFSGATAPYPPGF